MAHFGITVHTLVRNEDRYLWFALNSVLDHVDQVLISDTGSTDRTTEIIKSISSPKIIFQEYGPQTPAGVTALRERQLKQTKTKWFLVLDGDEVWYQTSLTKALSNIRDHPSAYGLITPTTNLIRDIYHYQDASAGRYHFAGRTGHLAVRFMRADIKGLSVGADYPLEGYYGADGRLITDHTDKLLYQDSGYLHATNLSRSTADETQVLSRVKKYELGTAFPTNFKYPEVFYKPRPSIVPNPWVHASTLTTIRSALETPLKLIKRSLIKS